MAEFSAAVYQNEFLPDGGTDVHAIVTVAHRRRRRCVRGCHDVLRSWAGWDMSNVPRATMNPGSPDLAPNQATPEPGIPGMPPFA